MAKKPVVRALMGAPSKYKPEYCQMLIEHMNDGFSYTIFAGEIDVNLDTLYEWEKVHPEFSEAKKKAFLKCQKFWEKKAIDHLVNRSSKEEGSESLNTALWIFNMKNRFKWTDRMEVTPQPEKPSGLEELSDEEILKLS